MPELLQVDITNVNIGGGIKVSNLSYPNLELLDPGQSMVVGVASSRVTAKGMEVTEQAAPSAESATETA
jgi:hypothetical protein